MKNDIVEELIKKYVSDLKSEIKKKRKKWFQRDFIIFSNLN